ncbi:MAG: hypothetical protein QM640_13560 [Niabella sp.]
MACYKGQVYCLPHPLLIMERLAAWMYIAMRRAQLVILPGLSAAVFGNKDGVEPNRKLSDDGI